jgi:uncharacterized protein YutE (UPF0331/DUF86 family)
MEDAVSERHDTDTLPENTAETLKNMRSYRKLLVMLNIIQRK